MRARRVHRILATAAVSAVLGVPGVVMGPATANAADTVVLATCAATVHGQPGQAIALTPAALTPQITAALAPLDPLNALRPPLAVIWNALPPIPLGAVGQNDGVISGFAIADAVVGQVRGIALLAPVIDALTPPLRALVSNNCGVATVPDKPAPPAPPAPPPPSAGAPPVAPGQSPNQPGNPPAVGQPGTGTQTTQPWPPGAGLSPVYPPAVGNGGMPGIPPDGIAFNYGPGGVPQVADSGVGTTTMGARSTGTAEALPGPSGDDLGRPVLLATLLVALVGGQLVRTWVLRRAKDS